MTQDIPPSGSPPSGPPKGLLAAAINAATVEDTTIAAKEPEEVARIPMSSLDPNYTEPFTIENIRKEIAVQFPQDAPNAPSDCGVPMDALRIQALLFVLCARVETLEKAIKPFATKAMLMANAQMVLKASGRAGEPAGGTWVSGQNQISMSADEVLFFDACDAYGRARTEGVMMEAFLRIQAGQSLAAEKAKHITDGGVTH